MLSINLELVFIRKLVKLVIEFSPVVRIFFWVGYCMPNNNNDYYYYYY